MIWAPLLAAAAIVLPGAGLELTMHRRSPGAFVRVVRSFLLSLAFWPLALFLTRVPFVSLRVLAWIGIAGGAALVVRARSLAQRPPAVGALGAPGDHAERWAAASFVAVALVHLLPARAWLVAPGNDMSMHTFMTRLIVEAGRMPTSYAPLYPIPDFGSYAAGMPATAAILTTLTGAPVRTTTLVAGLLAYPALIGGLALVARRFAAAIPALLAACAVVGVCEMHAYLLWGGNPTVLAFALVFAAVAPLVNLRADDDARASFPLLATGAGLVHVIPVLGMAYALPLAGLLWLRRVPANARRSTVRAWLVLFAIAALLLAVPYASGARPHVSAHELQWIARWQRTTWHAYPGNAANFAVTIWPYLFKHLGWGVALLGAGVLAQARLRDARQLPWIPYVAVVLLLVLNSRYWVLPGSPGLYPERMLVLLLAPGAAFVACLLGALPFAGALALGLALCGWAFARADLAVERAGQRITVTANDLAALDWMHDHLPPDAVVANNYGDAGAWIPALAFRAATHPHTNPFYFDEIDEWRQRTAPTFLFVGEKQQYDIQYRREVVLAMRGEYTQLHAAGNAVVLAIVHPKPAPPTESWMGR